MSIIDDVRSARSLLFVPASRPDRFEKARESGADLVILDLEDAVADDLKARALADVVDAVDRSPSRLVVRVNGAGTPWHAQELAALAGSQVAVMLPKAESAEQLGAVAGTVPAVIALVETPRGVLAADELAGVAGVTRLALGNVDLAAALGVDPASRAALWRARTELVLASAAQGSAGPIDGVTTVLDAPGPLADDIAHAVELGFTGKLCIHPRQVAAVNDGWQPTPEQIGWARKVVATTGQGAVAVDGEMVDAPVVERARAILARAERPDRAEGPGGTCA